MRKLRLVFGSICCLLISIEFMGCSPLPALMQSDVVGKYRIEYLYIKGAKTVRQDIEILILKPDGTYTQTFTPSNRKLSPVTNGGKWTLDNSNGTHITLEDSLDVPDPDVLLKYPLGHTNMSMPVEVFHGNISFCRGADYGLYYTKIR